MYLTSLDLANRALLHYGEAFIVNIDEDSKANDKLSFTYDKLRRAELRRNVWKFAIRKCPMRALETTTMLLDPVEWDAAAVYTLGSIIKDENGFFWRSMIPENLNNDPLTSAGAWEAYFGPAVVHEYDDSQSYLAGELVYKAVGTGGYVVFVSLESDNEDDPADYVNNAAYSATVTYHQGQVSYSGGFMWRSLIELNTGNTPAEAPTAHDMTATYSTGQQVTATDGFIYTSAINGNIGFNPVGDDGSHWTATGSPAAWTKVPTIYGSSTKWLPVFASIRSLGLIWPIGAGPLSNSSNRNVYRLPAGHLRYADQNPKAGSVSSLGGPTGKSYKDWEFEGDYIITTQQAFVYRFVADITDVTKMDDMFCEGLSARMAFETCEAITQSGSKKRDIGAAYTKFMNEARVVNAIELGPVEPDEDDYISCRQ